MLPSDDSSASPNDDDDELLTSGQASSMLNVHPKTLSRWEREGRIVSLRLPSGHRRYRKTEIAALLRRPERAAS